MQGEEKIKKMNNAERNARKKEKMIENARRDRARREARKASAARGKAKNPFLTFISTFAVAFAVFVLICSPVLAMVGHVANTNLFGDDSPVLEDELDLLISEDSPFFEEFTNVNRANVLLLGVNDGLTDTIMLVSFDMDKKHVDVISVPRDTYYHRQGYNGQAEDKINAAYRKNPANTAKAVSDILLGIPINYYAVIDYDGVSNIVDAMGGVPMDIPFTMKYNDPYDTPPLKIYIEKGPQVLDGEHAVQFLRYRKGYVEGDMGRVKAHQQFVKNAFKQCLSFELPKIAKTVFQNVDSDITIGTAVSLATKAVGIKSDSITTYTIPHTLDPEPPYYVYPDSQGIAEMITEIYSYDDEKTTAGAVSSGDSSANTEN